LLSWVLLDILNNWEHCSVWELASSAHKDLSALANHLWSPSELLAVKHEGGQIFIKSHLGGVSASLEDSNASLGDWDGGDDGVHVSVDVSLVHSDAHVVVHDVLLGGGHVQLEELDGLLESLDRY